MNKHYGDYYLIKAFPNQDYRDQFNSGKWYINSVEYFHNHGDDFQRDFEGGVFRQTQMSKGMLVFSRGQHSFEELLEKYKKDQFAISDIIIPTESFKIFIQGYICCFSLFPKTEMRVDENSIVFARNSFVQKDFYLYLNEYAKKQGYAFISVYDAECFISKFYRYLTMLGFSVSFGTIKYEPILEEKRIRQFQGGSIRDIVFTKDASYAYQKELRFFLQTDEEYKEHIEIDGIDLQSSVICSLAYLTKDYVQRNNILG